MFIKIINPKTDGKGRYTNAGSCRMLVDYLSKEDGVKGLDREFYFNHRGDVFVGDQVVAAIDSNAPLVGKEEAKFYSLVISPSEQELKHLNRDWSLLKEYTKEVMNLYAQHFNGRDGQNKGLKAEDLVYFAKLENHRYYKATDLEVLGGMVHKGKELKNDNTHIHIVVSRMDVSKRTKLSPLANSKTLFNREEFKLKSCRHFDQKFAYLGAGKEIERRQVVRDGTVEEMKAYFLKEYERKALEAAYEKVKAFLAELIAELIKLKEKVLEQGKGVGVENKAERDRVNDREKELERGAGKDEKLAKGVEKGVASEGEVKKLVKGEGKGLEERADKKAEQGKGKGVGMV